MAEGFLYDRGDELIERKDLSESLVPKIDPDTDEGKTLTVDSEGKAKWETPESGLPAITPTTDQGKVLMVGSDDEPEWANIVSDKDIMVGSLSAAPHSTSDLTVTFNKSDLKKFVESNATIPVFVQYNGITWPNYLLPVQNAFWNPGSHVFSVDIVCFRVGTGVLYARTVASAAVDYEGTGTFTASQDNPTKSYTLTPDA